MSNEQVNMIEQLKSFDVEEREAALQKNIERFVRKVLLIKKREEVDNHAPFNDLGIDSVAAVQLTKMINESLDDSFELASTDIFDYPTIQLLSNHIAEKLHESGLDIEISSKDKSKVEEDIKIKEKTRVEGMTKEELFKELDEEE